MTVKELIGELKKYEEDIEVKYAEFEIEGIVKSIIPIEIIGNGYENESLVLVLRQY